MDLGKSSNHQPQILDLSQPQKAAVTARRGANTTHNRATPSTRLQKAHHTYSSANPTINKVRAHNAQRNQQTRTLDQPQKPALSSERLDRAKAYQRSQNINRFGDIRRNTTSAEPEVVARPTPSQQPSTAEPKAVQPSNNMNHGHVYSLKQPAQHQNQSRSITYPSTIQPSAPAPSTIVQPQIQTPAIDESQHIADVADHLAAVNEIPDNDGQVEHPKGSWFSRHRTVTTAAAAMASFLIVGGYIAYLNMPSIALQVAGTRAGFAARMPAYLPSDYDFSGPVTWSPGQIVLSFSGDNGVGSDFTITQRKTQLDSESLLRTYVLGRDQDYATYQEKGLTIYLLGEGEAAWINRGIWYTLSGSHNLTSEQVVKVASSL